MLKVIDFYIFRRQNNTNSVTLYKYEEKLELIYTGEAYKPGMPYTCYLKISKQDGTLVRDDLNKVSVKSGFGEDTTKYGTLDYDIPEDGIIRLAFFAPGESAGSVLGIEATYKGQSQWFSTIPRAYSASSNYLQARLASERPRVNSNVKIEIRTTEAIDTFSYVVIGRGNILNAGTVKNPISNKQTFLLPTTRDMSPRARVVVSYFRPDGEIVGDSLDFEVEGVLSNKLEISMDKQIAFAGSRVEITASARPNSFIGLLAIDKSVRSLQSGNDIRERDVVEELRSYNSGTDPSFLPWVQTIKNQQGSLSWHTGSRDALDVFRQSGLIMITRGYLPQNPNFSQNAEERGQNRTIGRPILPPDAKTVQPDQGPGIAYETATRPPLEGPYAFSRIPSPADDLPKIFLKNDLPATWLFTNTTTNSDGNAVMTVELPELTNTTWTISGFAINQLDGMGISQSIPEVDLFQPFYVLANLPYSVRLGETLAVEMVVFNYLSQEITADVTLENPNGDSFQFGYPDPDAIEEDDTFLELFRTKSITIRPEGKTSVSFVITPKKVGDIDIKIVAKSSTSGQDQEVKTLRVIGEGETIRKSNAFMVDLTNKGVEELNITVDYPKYLVNGTKSVHLATVPDPLGPAINYVQNLVNLPTDCGEQNLVHIIPPVTFLDYMQRTGRSTNDKVRQLKDIMGLGYQNQLNYIRNDGAFSPFGKTDGFGSIWLTAMTAGALQGASRYVDIDGRVINRALVWLVDNQQRDGSFKEQDRNQIFHKVQEEPVALTAFVVLGFLDNKRNLTANIRNSMNKAIDYIALNWDSIEDPYHLSVVTYALHKSLHPSKDPAWAKLEGLSTEKKGLKWWQMVLPDDWANNPRVNDPNTINIETTAYALLTMADRGSITDAVPVVNWLFTQQNGQGGYVSTSDTYVALKALAEFNIGFSIQDRNTAMSIQYAFLDTVKRMELTSDYPIRQLKNSLPSETDEVRIRAKGSGVAVLQVNYQYNLAVTAAWPSFVLQPKVSRVSDAHHIQISACVHFIELTSVPRSLMSVMEIYLPSGFTVNQDALPALRRYRDTKRVETDNEGTKVVIYFGSIEKKEVCPTIQAFRTHRVANQRPAHVVVYDYYDQTKRARSFYDVPPATLCDICEGEDCPNSGCSRDSFASPYYEGNPFDDAYYSGRLGGGASGQSVTSTFLLVTSTLLALYQRLL